MALSLRITTQAKRDTGRILGFIAKENPDAATRLAAEIERGVLRLLVYPLSGPVLPNRINQGIRQLILPPLRILYRVTEEELYLVGVMRCEQHLEESELEGP